MTKKHWKNMKWNCFEWDINRDKLVWFNVLSDDLLDDIKKAHTKKQINNKEDLSNIVRIWAMHHYWSKCEHETLITDFPKYKNEYKMDVFEQLQNNWQIFIDYLIKGLELNL